MRKCASDWCTHCLTRGPYDAEFVASRDAGLIAAGALMYALLGVLLLAAAFYLVWVSVHRLASSRAHFVKVAEPAPADKVGHALQVEVRSGSGWC